MHIFTDCSVSRNFGKATGSFLFSDSLDTVDPAHIKLIQFDSRSSTIAEYLTIGHVFDYLNILYEKLVDDIPEIYLYTDCENFVKLVSIRKNKIKTTHRNYSLYQYLIQTVEKFKINVIWTKGHLEKELQKEKHQKIFPLVDTHARQNLRKIIKSQTNQIDQSDQNNRPDPVEQPLDLIEQPLDPIEQILDLTDQSNQNDLINK